MVRRGLAGNTLSFLVVIETGSIRRAAEVLGIAQSAVSR